MGYVAAGILVLLLLGGFITFLVMQATRRSSPATESSGPAIGSDPNSAFGDTEQHSDDHPDAAGSPDPAGRADPPAGRFKRDPIGGEAEGEPTVAADPPKSTSR
jgi:hypothetical protein